MNQPNDSSQQEPRSSDRLSKQTTALPTAAASRDKPLAKVHSSSGLLSTPESTSKPLVRKLASERSAAEQNLARRRSGALVMSVIAIASLFFRRTNYDLPAMMLTELMIGTGIVGLLMWLALGRKPKLNSRAPTIDARPWRVPLVSALVAVPWLCDLLGRSLGGGNGREIQMLGSLAWGSMAAAVVGTTARTISISVICSGFLTLFATFISDSGRATLFAYSWGILCLWWLVSNHWESVEYQAASEVKATGRHRIFTLIVGCLLFFGVTVLMTDRVPVLRKLKAELMPTSGGTTAKDSVGRGIGNGDALVAARNHPTSFGAVETDMFLESTKPSLFDVVSEEFGRPRINRRIERAQSLNSNDIQVKGGNFSEANKSSSGSDFSTQRNAPKTREKPNSIVSESIMFWAGSAAAHLAVERFDRFDGVDWKSSKSAANQSSASGQSLNTPLAIDLEKQVWFYASESAFPNESSPFVDALPESLKFTRFNSAVVPTRCGLQMWCVDRLEQANFFAVDSMGLISMPGREQVPEYTVVRMINSRIDREKTERLLDQWSPRSTQLQLPDACVEQLDQWLQKWTSNTPTGLSQIETVIAGLRRDFSYDRDWVADDSTDSPIPLHQFLESRRGPSYLFATAATQLLSRLGYETRLVTGFYANSRNYITSDHEIGILPQDAHVWLEINVGRYWIPLEPTPGFDGERLSVGLWYRIKQARYIIGLAMVAIPICVLLLYALRGVLLEALCAVAWPLVAMASDRGRVVWLARLLDLRSRLAGIPRQKGKALRAHLSCADLALPTDLRSVLNQYCQAADRLCFGGAPQLDSHDRQAIRQLWQRLTYFSLRRAQVANRPNQTKQVGTL